MDGNTQDTNMSLDGKYLANDLDGAIKILLESKDQFKSGVFSYNLGTIYAKKSDWPLARYHLEKAYREGFYSPRLFNNLKLVEERLGVREVKTHSFLERIAFNTAEHPTLFWIFTPLAVAMLLLIFTRFVKRIRPIYLIMILIISCIPCALSFVAKSYFHMGIVFKDTALYESPSEIHAPRRNIIGGEKILVIKNKNGWHEVVFPSEYSGWVKNTNLGLF